MTSLPVVKSPTVFSRELLISPVHELLAPLMFTDLDLRRVGCFKGCNNGEDGDFLASG